MSRRTNRSRESGFTLLEMSVVLVIIGMILGAISIGKDLQRAAEYKQFKQKFVDQWAAAYNEFYQKYGVVLGDSEVAPTYAVNGGNPDFHDLFLAHGTMDYGDEGGVDLEPPRICHRDDDNPAFPKDGDDANDLNDDRDADSDVDLHDFFDEAGIRMPPGRAEGREDRYVYLDSNGNPQEAAICFQWNEPETWSNSGNVMVLVGLTPDLARHLDDMIDGKPDAREGMFRQQGTMNDTDGVPGVVWSTDNRDKFAEGGGDNSNLDENQVATVTAHYKMNQ